MQGRLKASLHHARFIDLGIQDDPAAVSPPWGYYNPEEKESYGSVREAFEDSHGRLLLLGEPGAGKTTALLHIALELLRAAEASPTAPLPLIVNLSKFRFPKPSQERFGVGGLSEKRTRADDAGRKLAFENWLIGELAAYPGLSHATAREWLCAGRIAALLDGLDEFNDERRAELAELLNDTFLRDHPELSVVICSRTNEYKVLASDKKSRLQLEAAVHLQPLSEPQVAAYLKAAKAEDLLDTLAADAALRELSRTPLTLSMLVLAYGGRAPERSPARTGLSETRLRLFDAYVERMLQRQARRRCGKPFDDVVAHDVPLGDYQYHPGAINRWLGWLAVTLSVRMRTSFSLGSLTRILLTSSTPPSGQWLNFCFAYWAIGAFAALAVAAVAMLIVPPSAALAGAAIIATGMLLLPGLGTVRHEWDTGFALGIITWGIAVLSGVAILSHLLAGLAPSLSPYLLPPILTTTLMIVLIFIETPDDDALPPMIVGLFFAVAFAAALWVYPIGWLGPLWSDMLAGLLVWAPIVTAFPVAMKFDFRNEGLLVLGILLGVVVASLALTWLSGGQGWLTPLLAATAAAAAACGTLEPRRGIGIAALSAPFAIAGSLLDGPRGLFVALALCAAVGGLAYWMADAAGRDKAHRASDRIFTALDALLLSPLLWLFLAAARRFALGRRRFLNSMVDAFLLKRSRLEFEFIHRLLRDHFALRQLVPLLQSEGRAKLETVRALGYQGEAALDLLLEYSTRTEPALRAAAVAALAHIPSPVATAALRERAGDSAPEVRHELILALAKLASDQQGPFLDAMNPLGDGSEVAAILKTFPDWRRLRAQNFVLRMGESAIGPLLQALKQGPMKRRIDAAGHLGDLATARHVADKRIVDGLVDQLGTRNAALREAVVEALSRQPVAPELFERLQADRNRRVRTAARIANERQLKNWSRFGTARWPG